MTGVGRLTPVSGCLYGSSLPGPGLTRILPFKFRGVPQPGFIAFGEVRPGAIIQNVKAVEGDPHKHRGHIQWSLTPLTEHY